MTPPKRATPVSIQNRELEAQLLVEEIRHEKAKADLAEIELAAALDKERDRLVRGGKVRHLNISDPIIGMHTDAWLDALNHWERRDPGGKIEITIMSPGGSITDGLAIYDTIMRLRRKGHEVTTRGQGLVASMAGVLLQAGDERIMDARAKLLIHEGALILSGGEQAITPGEAEDMRTFSEMLRNDIAEILSSRSQLTKQQITRKWKRRDWYLDANEALKLGFVDRVE